MLEAIHKIYGNKVIKNKMKREPVRSTPAIYESVIEVLKVKPIRRVDLLAKGFKTSSLDSVIKLLHQEGKLEKTTLTNSKGHKTGLLYRLLSEKEIELNNSI